MSFTIRRLIRATPERVFALYTDPARLHEWQPSATGLSERTGPLDRPGTSYVLEAPGPRLRIEVLRVDAPWLHEQREGFAWYCWIGTARFEPLPGCRTRFSFRYQAAGRYWWLGMVFLPMSALFGWLEFNRLKRVAEET